MDPRERPREGRVAQGSRVNLVRGRCEMAAMMLVIVLPVPVRRWLSVLACVAATCRLSHHAQAQPDAQSQLTAVAVIRLITARGWHQAYKPGSS